MAFVKIGDGLFNTNEIINIEIHRKIYDCFDRVESFEYKITFRNETESYIISYKNLDNIQSDINNLIDD